MTVRMRFSCFALLLLGLLAGGCGTPLVRHAVPDNLRNQAVVPGMPAGVRAWGDESSPAFQKSIAESEAQARAAYADRPPIDILTISGGGSGGAFGAGLLSGWTDAKTRPMFRIVTGVSAGAIIAPFAFLGSQYDPQLRELSTKVTDKDVFELKNLLSVFGSDSLSSTAPLKRLLDRYYDERLITAVAAEHAKGRRLFVATTDLDAQRPVIWDMGAIASSGAPNRVELFRQVILASAAIPVYFPPVYLQVEAGGNRYDEMHVDGGTTDQVTLYGDALAPLETFRRNSARAAVVVPRVFIIRNAKVVPEPESVRPRLLDIADRSVAALTKSEGIGDLYRIYALTQREQFDFNLAYVPDDFSSGSPEASEGFDPQVMTRLFDTAYLLGRYGYEWKKMPPGMVSSTTKPLNR